MTSNEITSAGGGHEFAVLHSGYLQNTKGLVVVVQEIFGVNEHIRSVADRYAELGYKAVAPSLFDRVQEKC